MSQQDIFENEELDPSVLEHISELSDNDPKWPATLLGLNGILNQELDNPALSLKLVLKIGEYMGGIQHYLPRGDQLKKFIRNLNIYQEFNGRNVSQLAKRYQLSDKAVYEIIAKMRKAEMKRRQMQLF